MARHRRYRRYDDRIVESNEPGGQNLGGILNLLGNVDLNQVGGLINGFSNILSNMNIPQGSQSSVNSVENVENVNPREINAGVPNIQRASKEELLRALQTILNSDKTELLQLIIQLYSASKSGQNTT
jgi:hypothetical protein